ncbi:MAG: 50S ribosomal protein L22 [Candidatus Woesearchaeota archaeon]
MMRYAFKLENVGISYGKNLPISRKHAYELAKYIRKKQINKVIRILQDVIALKRPIPYTRYRRDLSHKRDIGSGRFPVKAAKYFLKLLENAINNAKEKGLDENKLYLIHCSVHKGERSFRRGRRYRRAKSTHVQMAVGYVNEA